MNKQWDNRRRVWSAVSKHPQATTRELADMTGIKSQNSVSRHLHFLREIGYIDFAHNAARARRIIVPCGVQQ